MSKVIPMVVIGGPTAAGKTAAAIRAARAVEGEIVSADSMQIYKYMDIGTAKPGEEERRSARIHLIDFVEPDSPYTVADFQQDAEGKIREIDGRGNLPILCGGTGLYIRALLQHFDFPPAEPAERARVREELEEELEASGSEMLHERLGQVDAAAAEQIDAADGKRIVRALEVYELTGERFSDQQRVDAQPPVTYNPVYYVVTRPRAQLYAAIEQRVDEMMAAGWVEEVRRLRSRGYDASLQSMQAIGYRHLLEWLAGGEGDELAEVVATIKRDTRRFAKRQLTWFRSEEGTRWVRWANSEDYDRVVEEIIRGARQRHDAGGRIPQRQ